MQTPQLQEDLLDRDTFEQLLLDLRHCATDLHVVARPPCRRGRPMPVTLEQGRELLLTGAAPALQLRYHFDNAFWCDTLITTTDAIRIVRIREEP